MADVTVSIGGSSYTIACREGEEPHLREIAQIVDQKANEAREAVGGVSEVRLLLFASLLLADELAESRQNRAATPAQPTANGGASPAPAHADAIERLASRLEMLANRLENRA